MDITEIFEKFDDEYLKFERVEKKLSNRPDLHAFILLDRLLPGSTDMVGCAEHDEIYLDVEIGEFSNVATEDNIRDLVRCGVRFDDDVYSLAMFV